MRSLKLITVLFLSVASFSAAGCAAGGDEYADEYGDVDSSATSPGHIDLYQSSDAQWRFRVVSGNGRTLLSSEAYVSKAGAQNGIDAVLENGVDPAMYQVNQTAAGSFNLRLRAGNYETIASTQGYSTKSNATRAIDTCVRAITTYLDATVGAEQTAQSAE
jgi:uncharacterized protein